MPTTRGFTMPVEERDCTVCKKTKPLDEFGKQKNGKFGRKPNCKSCESKYGKKKYKRLSATNPELFWEKHLWVNHRITPEAYYKRLAEQGGLCAVCLQPPPQQGHLTRLAVDHDHACCPTNTSCGKCIRGLVCHNCNVSMGLLKDNPTIFRLAAQYLERSKK
jgi:Recombination endonuclease VII